jgi:GTP diphosphokinase / guanosine-3',5'-bis(diphosphate) 3'-diphosphatase
MTLQLAQDRTTRAIALACAIHERQVDLAGQPAILHAVRVMLAMATEDERIAAVLHDTIEDAEDPMRVRATIEAGFSPAVAEAMRCLTRHKKGGETYEDYLARCRANPIARRVKLADLRDNLSRPASLPDSKRRRYLRGLAILLDM